MSCGAFPAERNFGSFVSGEASSGWGVMPKYKLFRNVTPWPDYFAPFPLAFEVKNIVFEIRIDRRTAFRKDARVILLSYKMSIVVDVYISRVTLGIESIKVDSLAIVYA